MMKYGKLSTAVLALTLSSGAFAADYGRHKVAQWGDPFTPPQIRTRCIGYAWGNWPWGGKWKTCNQWATDTKTMQVVIWAKAIGPDQLSQAAVAVVQEVAKVCATAAGVASVGALIGTPSPEVSARLAAAYAAATATFTGCIGTKASSLTAVGVATGALKFAFEQSASWSNWSNE